MTINWDSYREEFPVTEKYAYFQHPAVTALPNACREAVSEFLADQNNHGCLNESEWRREVQSVRRLASQLVNVDPERIGFVRNTSHGLSMIAQSLDLSPGSEIVVPESEFPANIYPWKNLEQNGVSVRTVEMTEGSVFLEDIEEVATEETNLVSISSVQFKTGFRADLEAIGNWCMENGIDFVVDGIQSLGWDPLDLSALPIDALVADAHKWLCAPEGIGVCYLNKEFQERLSWSNVGWKSVKNPYRFDDVCFDLKEEASVMEEGSSNHLGLMGLGASLRLLMEVGIDSIKRRNMSLAEEGAEKLRERGFTILSDRWSERFHSPIIVANHPDWDERDLVNRLNERNIQLSYRGGAMRLGLHFYNNRSDLRQLENAIDEVT